MMEEYRHITRDEVPFDDGTPTGYVFVYLQVARRIDPLTGEPDWMDTDHVFGPMTMSEAEGFMAKDAG